MISADVTANKHNNTEQEIKDLVVVSSSFLQEVTTKLEIVCKNGMDFSFDFGQYSFHAILILPVKNMGVGVLA